MHRVLLINKSKNPTREEMSTSERSVGELFMAKFELSWAGYNLIPDQAKKAAGWIVREDQAPALRTYLSEYSLDGYELALYEPCITVHGGFGHRRSI